MKDPASRKSTWFWVGVTLISLSALFWLIVILTIESEGAGEVVLFGVICTAIPVGIGIYGVVRGRESLEAATLTRERTHVEDLPFTKDTKAETLDELDSLSSLSNRKLEEIKPIIEEDFKLERERLE